MSMSTFHTHIHACPSLSRNKHSHQPHFYPNKVQNEKKIPLLKKTSLTSTVTKSADTDEILQDAASRQGLHCLSG